MNPATLAAIQLGSTAGPSIVETHGGAALIRASSLIPSLSMAWEAAMNKPILTLQELDAAVAAAGSKAKKANRPHSPLVENQVSLVALTRASELKATPISWVWPGWLARGKAQIIGGQPGAGKTTLAMLIAAIVTIAGRWPDGTSATKGNVIIWSGEDDPTDTLVPRLAVSGADLTRVFFVESVFEGKERRPFDPAKDIGPLKQAIEANGGAVLLVIDPIVSAVAGDSHKNGDTRRSLQPLVDLASDVGAALLGITHFSKGTAGREPIERITGSIAFGALARVVMVAAKEPDAEDATAGRRILARAKSNIGPDEGGFAYSLQLVPMPSRDDIEASIAVWGERIVGTAREILAEAETVRGDDDEGGKFREAKDWLLDFLMDGPRGAKECRSASSRDGHRWRTIERAKTELKISSVRGDSGWAWALPQDQDRQDNRHHSNYASPGGVGGLGGIKQNQEVTKGQDRQINQVRQRRQEFGVGDVAGQNGGLDGWEGEI
jgi:putative DNA primase/helicase